MVVGKPPAPHAVDVAQFGEAAFRCGGRGGYAKGVACDGPHKGVLIGMRCPPFQGGLCVRLPFHTEVMVLVGLPQNVRLGCLCITP